MGSNPHLTVAGFPVPDWFAKPCLRQAKPKYRSKKAPRLARTVCFLAARPLSLQNRETGGNILVIAVPADLPGDFVKPRSIKTFQSRNIQRANGFLQQDLGGQI